MSIIKVLRNKIEFLKSLCFLDPLNLEKDPDDISAYKNVASTQDMRICRLCFAAGAERVTIDGGRLMKTVAGLVINITCHASPSRPPVDVTWYSLLHNEATMTENEAAGSVWTYRTVLADKKRHNVTSVLTIRANRNDNDRVYRCSVINVAMSTPISATVKLTVQCKQIIFILSLNKQEIRYVEHGYLSHCFKSRTRDLGHAPFGVIHRPLCST